MLKLTPEPYTYTMQPLYYMKVTVGLRDPAKGVIGIYFFKDERGVLTTTDDRYHGCTSSKIGMRNC